MFPHKDVRPAADQERQAAPGLQPGDGAQQRRHVAPHDGRQAGQDRGREPFPPPRVHTRTVRVRRRCLFLPGLPAHYPTRGQRRGGPPPVPEVQGLGLWTRVLVPLRPVLAGHVRGGGVRAGDPRLQQSERGEGPGGAQM